MCRYRDLWPASRDFVLPTFYDGRARVNLAGRERDGIVDLDGYERTLHEIESEVRDALDVPATILALLHGGLPPGADLDGRPFWDPGSR